MDIINVTLLNADDVKMGWIISVAAAAVVAG